MSKSALAAVLLSAAVGIGAMLYFRTMPNVYFVAGPGPYEHAWQMTIIPIVVVFSLILGAMEPRAPWLWPLLIMGVHYFSGFALVKPWGQIPPFEFLYFELLALPGIAAAYLGAHLRKRFGNAT
jgi:hypothetical protein